MRITQPAPFIWAAPPFARRNVWQMFRREFTLDFPPETASLHITADTRYTLFVNGVRLGSGPMKYFQAHIPYDTYDIAPCLRCGKNVIGVLVHYWGVGTMQHQFGEPGLWLQAIVQGGERRLEIGTGPEFLTAPCAALDLPEPVPPPSSTCGIRLRSSETVPSRLLPSTWTCPAGRISPPPATTPIPSAGRPPSPPPGTRPCCLPGISRL